MLTGNTLKNYLTKAFTPDQATLLSEMITDVHAGLVKTHDFSEAQDRTERSLERLSVAQEHTEKSLERLSIAQERTEARLERLSAAQERTEEGFKRLSAAQERTEERLERLSAAQERTEERLERLSAAQERTEEALQTLVKGLDQTRSSVAGLSKSFGYALENEAYRALPGLLDEQYQIDIRQRFVRTYIRDQEINFFAQGIQHGENILVIGEAKAQLRVRDFKQLETHLETVRLAQAEGELPAHRIIPLFVTHIARPETLERAKDKGIVVVQSFEW